MQFQTARTRKDKADANRNVQTNEIATNRLLQVRSRQIDVFGMCKEDVTKLKMSARLDTWRWLEVKDCLQTLNARFNIRRTRCAKILS
jgi:hypothetical protein